MSEEEPMMRLPSREEEEVEEALGEIYKLLEKGEQSKVEIEKKIGESIGPGLTAALEKQGLTRVEGERLALSAEGEQRAQNIIRRCRLSERLLADVLNIKTDQISSAACQFEHVLSHEVSDSICTLLGHPSECPHQHAIPPGDCCSKSESVLASVVQPLSKLPSRNDAKIAYLLFKRNPEVYRLLSLGLVPGEKVRLLQRVPNFILEVGESQVAFDESIARDIYVRPLSSPNP